MQPAAPRYSWLIPDLAMLAACVTLFYCLFLFQGYRKLFRDSDAGWHIRAGERILATGRLPRTDPYSFTRGGQPWFAWEWAADVLAGAADRAAGLTGVALFYGAIIAAGIWMWFRLHWVLGGNLLVACAMTPLLLATCNIHWLARPHTIGWLFLLGWVWWLELPRARLTATDAILAGVLTSAWANFHGTFFLAPAIAGIYWLCRRASLWIVMVSAAAGLANPYGYRLYAHVFRYLTDTDLLSRIAEFQSFRFHDPGTEPIVATVILGMTGGALALTRRRVEHFLLAIMLTAMALRSARGLPLAALVLLPLANRAITGEIASWKSFVSYSNRLRSLDAGFRGWVVAPLALAACFALLETPAVHAATGFPPAEFPAAAWTHIPAGARLYAPDKYGGYLIYRSRGNLKVFFDGRSDFYGAEFLRQYERLVSLQPGWWNYWSSFGFTHALAPSGTPLVEGLETHGWKPVYQDQTATLLSKSGT